MAAQTLESYRQKAPRHGDARPRATPCARLGPRRARGSNALKARASVGYKILEEHNTKLSVLLAAPKLRPGSTRTRDEEPCGAAARRALQRGLARGPPRTQRAAAAAVYTMPKGDPEPEAEDPVKRETSLTASVFLRRTVVDARRTEIEAAAATARAKNVLTKHQTVQRRKASAEVYRFVQERLDQNHDAISALEITVDDARNEADAARTGFDDETAAITEARCCEIAALDGRAAADDAERSSLEVFAAAREGITADLVRGPAWGRRRGERRRGEIP